MALVLCITLGLRQLTPALLLVQGAAAPTVAQVLNAARYVSGNTSVVTPVATGLVELPAAYTDGTGSVTGIDMASAYDVYLVGQDNYTSPNTMANVGFLPLAQPSAWPASWDMTPADAQSA